MSDVRDASTVMVLREGESGLEVFMVKRHARMEFMANAFVYPGGKRDEHDGSDDILERVLGRTPDELARSLGIESRSRAVGLYLAGVRESFEEAGILLARGRAASSSEFFDLVSDAETAERFEGYRARLHANELSLAEVARDEDLVFPLDELAYFAHWITPTFESRRFDTRFFVARAPERQAPLHDARETTDSLWIRPEDAVERGQKAEFFLAPPTLRTLEQLAEFSSIDAVFAFCDGRRPPVILPHLAKDAPSPTLLLPGDPDFPADDPFYAQAVPVDDDVTRLVLREGTWHHA